MAPLTSVVNQQVRGLLTRPKDLTVQPPEQWLIGKRPIRTLYPLLSLGCSWNSARRGFFRKARSTASSLLATRSYSPPKCQAWPKVWWDNLSWPSVSDVLVLGLCLCQGTGAGSHLRGDRLAVARVRVATPAGLGDVSSAPPLPGASWAPGFLWHPGLCCGEEGSLTGENWLVVLLSFLFSSFLVFLRPGVSVSRCPAAIWLCPVGWSVC